MLGDEAPTVLSNKRWELIKHPAVDDLYKTKWRIHRLGKRGTYFSASVEFLGNSKCTILQS